MTKDMQICNKRFDIIFCAKNVLICFLLTIVILFIVSWISVMVNIPDAAVALIVSIVTYLCVAVCGFRVAKHSKRAGLLNGAVAGFVYVIILYFIGCIAFARISFNLSVLLSIVICVICGAAGGIVGVNTKIKKRR